MPLPSVAADVDPLINGAAGAGTEATGAGSAVPVGAGPAVPGVLEACEGVKTLVSTNDPMYSSLSQSSAEGKSTPQDSALKVSVPPSTPSPQVSAPEAAGRGGRR